MPAYDLTIVLIILPCLVGTVILIVIPVSMTLSNTRAEGLNQIEDTVLAAHSRTCWSSLLHGSRLLHRT